jgi:hypothetical protein
MSSTSAYFVFGIDSVVGAVDHGGKGFLELVELCLRGGPVVGGVYGVILGFLGSNLKLVDWR